MACRDSAAHRGDHRAPSRSMTGCFVGFSSSTLALVSTFCPPWELIQEDLGSPPDRGDIPNPPLPDLRPTRLLIQPAERPAHQVFQNSAAVRGAEKGSSPLHHIFLTLLLLTSLHF